jgi:hypothetical protein
VTALQIVAALVALGLAIAGVAGILWPERGERLYGAPPSGGEAHGFVRAAAVRDVVIAVILGAAAYVADVPVMVVVAIAGIALAACDAAIAYHASGKRWHRGHGVHLAGIVAFVLVLAMALLAVGI